MTAQNLTCDLSNGGSIDLVIDVDWLTINEADFRFVRELVDRMREYGITKDPPVAPVRAELVEAAAEPPKAEPKPKATNRKPAGRPSGSSSRRPPLAEVARVYNEARTAGTSTTKALMDAFGGSESTVRNWPAACRAAGLLDATVTEISDAPSAPGKKGPRSQGGRQPSVDYAAVATLIVELRDAGQSVQDGIVKRYSVPVSTAKNWMKRCRDLGLITAQTANLKVVEDNTGGDSSDAEYNAEAVADAYLEAIRTGRRPIQTVADTFVIDRAQAATWVRRAREDGALPSAAEPQLPEGERRAILDGYKPEPVA